MDKISNYKYIFVFLIFLVFWSLLLSISGALFTGYQLIDTVGLFDINNQLKSGSVSFFKVTKDCVISDSSVRLRPFYIFYHVLQIKIFGTNFLYRNILRLFLAVLTSFFLFLSIKRMSFSFLESMLFVLLSLIGAQSAIWWRIGPPETLAVFLFSISLYFTVLSIYLNKLKKLCTVFSILFMILSFLSKESFILIIPALVFLKIWLYKEKSNSWFSSIKRNIGSVIILLFLFIITLTFIKFFIGTAGIEYAGIEAVNITGYIQTFIVLSHHSNYIVVIIAVLISVFLFILNNKDNSFLKVRDIIKKFWPPAALFSLIVIPQIILYTKSGIFERYLIPGIFGYSFVLIYSLNYINKGILLENNIKINHKLYNNIRINIFISSAILVGIYISLIDWIRSNIYHLNYLIGSRYFLKVLSEKSNYIYRVLFLLMLLILILSIIYLLAYCIKKRFRILSRLNITKSVILSFKKNSRRTVLAIIVFVILLNLSIAYLSAYKFNLDGSNLLELKKTVEKEKGPDESLLIVGDIGNKVYGELTNAMGEYFKLGSNLNNIYYYHTPEGKFSKDKMIFFDIFDNIAEDLKKGNNISNVIIFDYFETDFLSKSEGWFNPDLYTKKIFDYIIFYYK